MADGEKRAGAKLCKTALKQFGDITSLCKRLLHFYLWNQARQLADSTCGVTVADVFHLETTTPGGMTPPPRLLQHLKIWTGGAADGAAIWWTERYANVTSTTCIITSTTEAVVLYHCAAVISADVLLMLSLHPLLQMRLKCEANTVPGKTSYFKIYAVFISYTWTKVKKTKIKVVWLHCWADSFSSTTV